MVVPASSVVMGVSDVEEGNSVMVIARDWVKAGAKGAAAGADAVMFFLTHDTTEADTVDVAIPQPRLHAVGQGAKEVTVGVSGQRVSFPGIVTSDWTTQFGTTQASVMAGQLLLLTVVVAV